MRSRTDLPRRATRAVRSIGNPFRGVAALTHFNGRRWKSRIRIIGTSARYEKVISARRLVDPESDLFLTRQYKNTPRQGGVRIHRSGFFADNRYLEDPDSQAHAPSVPDGRFIAQKPIGPFACAEYPAVQEMGPLRMRYLRLFCRS